MWKRKIETKAEEKQKDIKVVNLPPIQPKKRKWFSRGRREPLYVEMLRKKNAQ